jgi:hypothetical protein
LSEDRQWAVVRWTPEKSLEDLQSAFARAFFVEDWELNGNRNVVELPLTETEGKTLEDKGLEVIWYPTGFDPRHDYVM